MGVGGSGRGSGQRIPPGFWADPEKIAGLGKDKSQIKPTRILRRSQNNSDLNPKKSPPKPQKDPGRISNPSRRKIPTFLGGKFEIFEAFFLLFLQLFLDDTKVKNFVTCFKDVRFLSFFFRHLERNRVGRYQGRFPWVSRCGRERNFLRCSDLPVVFTQLLRGSRGSSLLSYCGGGAELAVPFQPGMLAVLPENGRLYHPAPERVGAVGLVRSALAQELSAGFRFRHGPEMPPTHFWAFPPLDLAIKIPGKSLGSEWGKHQNRREKS
uniref:Chromosome 8 open reading frame 82 n=1 Tax=Serinus canaria TaxID=9135 RepID=A0A8C9MKY1_SERCA